MATWPGVPRGTCETKMDLSLFISGLALVVSAFVAGWTVYRDAIQKPRFRVTAGVKSILQQGQPPIGPDFYVEALNLGPLPNRIGMVWVRPSWFDRVIRRKPSAVIMHDHGHLASTAKAQRVEVGDTATFVFPLNADFPLEEFGQIGVHDGYGRVHWASKATTANAIKQALKTLGRA